MHETDMTQALIMTVRNWWESQPERTAVETVHLTVGKFTCVEPASLQFAFDVQTRNTFLDQAQLVIQETPLVAFCHPCQQEYSPEYGSQYACPDCGQPMEDIKSGRELKIDRVEWARPHEDRKPDRITAETAAETAAETTAETTAQITERRPQKETHASNL